MKNWSHLYQKEKKNLPCRKASCVKGGTLQNQSEQNSPRSSARDSANHQLKYLRQGSHSHIWVLGKEVPKAKQRSGCPQIGSSLVLLAHFFSSYYNEIPKAEHLYAKEIYLTHSFGSIMLVPVKSPWLHCLVGGVSLRTDYIVRNPERSQGSPGRCLQSA